MSHMLCGSCVVILEHWRSEDFWLLQVAIVLSKVRGGTAVKHFCVVSSPFRVKCHLLLSGEDNDISASIPEGSHHWNRILSEKAHLSSPKIDRQHQLMCVWPVYADIVFDLHYTISLLCPIAWNLKTQFITFFFSLGEIWCSTQFIHSNYDKIIFFTFSRQIHCFPCEYKVFHMNYPL